MVYEFITSFTSSDLNDMDKTSLSTRFLKLQKQYDDLKEEHASILLQQEA